MNAIVQPELQRRTLRLYGELACRGESWGGKLVFAAFDGAAESGLAAAASLAGAASLVADADGASVKTHFRDGAFDFVVNTLDEALRAIKNEVRQRRPVAIGLIAAPEAVIAEAVERGLAADVILARVGHVPLAVAASDAVVLTEEASPQLVEWLRAKRWAEAELADEAVEDVVRQRWLRGLPAHQRSIRNGPRVAWVNAADQF